MSRSHQVFVTMAPFLGLSIHDKNQDDLDIQPTFSVHLRTPDSASRIACAVGGSLVVSLDLIDQARGDWSNAVSRWLNAEEKELAVLNVLGNTRSGDRRYWANHWPLSDEPWLRQVMVGAMAMRPDHLFLAGLCVRTFKPAVSRSVIELNELFGVPGVF